MADGRERAQQERIAATIEEEQAHAQYVKEIQEAQIEAADYINSHLLTLDQIKEEVKSGSSGIEEISSLRYGDKVIPVYRINDYPFHILSTRIDFKFDPYGAGAMRGSKTAEALLADPSIWTRKLSEVAKSSNFIPTTSSKTGDKSSLANTICTTMWNYDHRAEAGQWISELIYGFSHVDPDSILIVENGDAGSVGYIDPDKNNLDPARIKEGVKSISEALKDPNTRSENEITLSRYDDDGIPKKPDYIIASESKGITTTVLQHAAYHEVPIITINPYAHYQKRLVEHIESISNTTDYLKFRDEVLKLGDQLHIVQEIGSDEIADHNNPKPAFLERECAHISEIELEKRLKFIEKELSDASQILESIMTDKEKTMPASTPHFTCEIGHNKITIRFYYPGKEKRIVTVINDTEKSKNLYDKFSALVHKYNNAVKIYLENH